MSDVTRRETGADDLHNEVYEAEQLVLSDVINRVLDKGVVISSHIIISVAQIDLIAIDLKLLITSIATLAQKQAAARARDDRRFRSR